MDYSEYTDTHMTLKDVSLNKVGFWSLTLFMLVCPLLVHHQINLGLASLRVTQEQAFQLGVTVLFAIVVLRNIYLSLFLLWTVFLYCYWGFPAIGGGYLINIFFACLLYEVAYRVTNKNTMDGVFLSLIILCVLNTGLIALQLVGYDFIYQIYQNPLPQTHPVGFMGLKACMGMLFAMTIPFVLYYNRFLALTFFIPIYLSEASVAMVAGVVSVLWHLWHTRSKWFVAAVIALTLGGGVYVVQDSKAGMFEDRVDMWRVVMKDAVVHPITGWGLDSFRHFNSYEKNFLYAKNPRTQKTDKIKFHPETRSLVPSKGFAEPEDVIDPWDNAHNEYIQLFYEFGILPFFILGFLIKDIAKRFKFYENHLIALTGFFITFFIFSIGQFPFHLARLGYAFPIMLGVYYKLTEEKRHGKTEESY